MSLKFSIGDLVNTPMGVGRVQSTLGNNGVPYTVGMSSGHRCWRECDLSRDLSEDMTKLLQAAIDQDALFRCGLAPAKAEYDFKRNGFVNTPKGVGKIVSIESLPAGHYNYVVLYEPTPQFPNRMPFHLEWLRDDLSHDLSKEETERLAKKELPTVIPPTETLAERNKKNAEFYAAPGNHTPTIDEVKSGSANSMQVSGTHYQTAIQPWDFIIANKLDYLEGNVVKYVARWRKKNGIVDLEKARHYLTKLIEEAKKEVDTTPKITLAEAIERARTEWMRENPNG